MSGHEIPDTETPDAEDAEGFSGTADVDSRAPRRSGDTGLQGAAIVENHRSSMEDSVCSAVPSAVGGHALGAVSILGVGLIGGSLGSALLASGAADRVIGYDPDERGLQLAVERGAIDEAAGSQEAAAEVADLVVIAAPLGAVTPTLRAILPSLRDDAVVTDVASAKLRVVRQCQQLLGGRFVGGHPMAGSEESGVAAASPDLFMNAAWVLTPTILTEPDALARVRRMVSAVGARFRECDARTHDAMVAYLSHLPHLLSYGLARTAGRGVRSEWADLAAGSFRDCTRVAHSDPERWADILLDNSKAVSEALDAFILWASRARVALRAGDRAALSDMFLDAHRARQRFPK